MMGQFPLDKAILRNTWQVVAVVCLPLASLAVAQSSVDYHLSWSTIDGGGGTSSGGPYVLTGTIGQPDAAVMSGGNYELLGGFLAGRAAVLCGV